MFWGRTVITEVAIVEDEALLREHYADIIATSADMRVSWMAGSVAQARDELDVHPPDVLLVDIGLPDGSGIDVIRQVRQCRPECEVMVVSIFGDEQNVVSSIESGASGYLLKDTQSDYFLNTIRELRAGGSPISPSVARILLNRARGASPNEDIQEDQLIDLADREKEVLALVAKGFGFNEIGRVLGISGNTVKTHVYRIYRKLSVHSRGEAVYEARKMGLIQH